MEKTNIQSFNFDRSLKSIYISAQTVIFAVLVGLVILNPLWSNLSPPFPILRVTPSITAPVDGPYYLQNADNGYKWDVAEPLSLWYHPFLSVMISFMPEWLPSNIWFWLLSLTFSIGSLILTYQIASIYVDEVSLSPRLLFVILFVPGGLGIATGNPEIPTLFFTLLLLLSSIKWHNWWITIIAAIFAILTKPNALYMVPILFTYAIVGYKDGNKKLYNHSITGAVIIIVSWFGWMGFVDWKTNMWGAYWQTRTSFSEFVAGGPTEYFLKLAESFAYGVDLRDKVRYSTALIIPIVNLWIISFVPFSRNIHRYALAVGNLTMLALVLWQGNPNKVIVYATTIPGYFAVYMIFTVILARNNFFVNRIQQLAVSSLYYLYLALMIVFYVFGTPLGWYY